MVMVMTKNKRLHYAVVINGGYKTLLKTYSLSKAKKFRIQYANNNRLPRYKIGIDKFYWDKEVRGWYSDEIC